MFGLNEMTEEQAAELQKAMEQEMNNTSPQAQEKRTAYCFSCLVNEVANENLERMDKKPASHIVYEIENKETGKQQFSYISEGVQYFLDNQLSIAYLISPEAAQTVMVELEAEQREVIENSIYHVVDKSLSEKGAQGFIFSAKENCFFISTQDGMKKELFYNIVDGDELKKVLLSNLA